jgi:hypothetical protein
VIYEMHVWLWGPWAVEGAWLEICAIVCCVVIAAFVPALLSTWHKL